jgi:phosphoketolase
VAKAKQVELAVQPLSNEQLRKMYAYRRAANYLSVRQIYLKNNLRLERR